MIRNLKILMSAATAAVVFGAVSASGAPAAEFHCNVETGKSCTITMNPDGTGKTAHYVFIIKKGGLSGSITCSAVTAQGTAAKTSTELTVTNLVTSGCAVAGIPASVDTAGCDLRFRSNEGRVDAVCEAGKVFSVTTGACTVTIGSQALNGITYTNINSKKEVTVSMNVKNIHGIADEGCLGLLGFTGTFTEGEVTTGNTILKGYKDGFAHTEANQVNVWWE